MIEKKLVRPSTRELTDGVIVPLVTPVHIDEVFPLIDHIIKGGINKFIILGQQEKGRALNRRAESLSFSRWQPIWEIGLNLL